jgi:hypothetical protein
MMHFSHSAGSSSDRFVCLWIRISRSRSLLAMSASRLIPGKNEVKPRPFLLLIAPRPRKANPRNVKETCSWSPRRLLSLQ